MINICIATNKSLRILVNVLTNLLCYVTIYASKKGTEDKRMNARPIRIGYPSGKAKLTLWVGTEDEESFVIKDLTTKPYVIAYGNKYSLTKEETKLLNTMVSLIPNSSRTNE